MVERKIEPRPGVEIYISDKGYICIKQEQDYPVGEGDDVIVLLEPNMIPKVIEFLRDTLDEYLDKVKQQNADAREEDAH